MRTVEKIVAIALVFAALSCRNGTTMNLPESNGPVGEGEDLSPAQPAETPPVKAAQPVAPAPAPTRFTADGINVLDLAKTPQKPADDWLKPAKAEAKPAAPAQPAPVQPALPAPAAGPRKHVIQAGDTLWSLAVSYYNDGTQYKKIIEGNPGLDPQKLKVGQEIVIP